MLHVYVYVYVYVCGCLWEGRRGSVFADCLAVMFVDVSQPLLFGGGPPFLFCLFMDHPPGCVGSACSPRVGSGPAHAH